MSLRVAVSLIPACKRDAADTSDRTIHQHVSCLKKNDVRDDEG